MSTTYRISELAERSGVPTSTLRFYDASGLVPAERSPSGYRLYQESALERLAFIGLGKRFGLTLEEIAELLATRDTDACFHVKEQLHERLRARLADATDQQAELAAFADTVRSALDRLDTLADRSDPCDADCDVFGEGAPVRAQESGTRVSDANDESDAWRHAAVACSMSTRDIDDRAERWHATLAGAERRGIAEGLVITLPIARLQEVAELSATEQECCPFFDFRLQLDGSRFHLTVRASASGQSMLSELFDERRGPPGRAAPRPDEPRPTEPRPTEPRPAEPLTREDESCSPHDPSPCSSSPRSSRSAAPG